MATKGLNELVLAASSKLKVDDAIALSIDNREQMLRFANNSATVVKNVKETELVVYLAKDGRRAIASTSNPDEAKVKRFVGDLCSFDEGARKVGLRPAS